MLARRELPKEYRRWNRSWGVPDGKHLTMVGTVERLPPAAERAVLLNASVKRQRGPFAFQKNTSTRALSSTRGPTTS